MHCVIPDVCGTLQQRQQQQQEYGGVLEMSFPIARKSVGFFPLCEIKVDGKT